MPDEGKTSRFQEQEPAAGNLFGTGGTFGPSLFRAAFLCKQIPGDSSMKRSILLSSVFAIAMAPAALAVDTHGAQASFSDDHAYVDAEVRTMNGEDLGTVERVRFASNQQADIDAYVIETGGFLEIGGREILVNADDAEWTTNADGDQVLTLSYTGTQIASLPTFDESRVSDYWLSDDDMMDGDDSDHAGDHDGDDRMEMSDADHDRMSDETMASADVEADWSTDVETAAWDVEDWTDSTVYLSSGDQLGIVRDVRNDGDGVAALLIETDTAYDFSEGEIEVLIEDVVAVRENGMGNEVRVENAVATSGQ
jgi:sporulation protein YlmC with PRC-barrel domain